MKKLKNCIFSILTVLLFASMGAFASEVVPPDKSYSESIQFPVLDQGEILDLDNDIDLPKPQLMKEDKTEFSRVLSVDRGMKIEFNFLTPTINRIAVMQNQNFDRMPSQS